MTQNYNTVLIYTNYNAKKFAANIGRKCRALPERCSTGTRNFHISFFLCKFAVMKRLIFILLPLLVVLTGMARGIDEVPNVHVADARRYVSNPDGVLSVAAVAQLDSILASVWAQTSAEVVVVAIDETDSGDIDDYATKLFEKWGIGKKDKDNGLLILISKGDRKAALRTGYGMEAVLPDAISGRIIRNQMAPHYREGDYDGGTIAAVNAVATYLTDPDAAADIRSKYANDSTRATDEEVFGDLWRVIACTCCSLFAIAFFLVIYALYSTRKLDPATRFFKLKSFKVPVLMLGCLGLGLPMLAYLLLSWKMKRLRSAPRKCPNCDHEMHKLDEQHDNDYLTPAQDTEEKINSVDYDVWLCDNCGEKDIIPFVNENSTYSVCPQCGARASYLTADRVLVQPTTSAKGRGVKVYSCLNCRRNSNIPYDIAKIPVAPVIVIPGGGSGFGGGGGFSGGSFGGGMTGGGGASGGW